MRRLAAPLAHTFMGVVGLVFGALSAAALIVAAIIPPVLGLCALLLSPLRALRDRLRRP